MKLLKILLITSLSFLFIKTTAQTNSNALSWQMNAAYSNYLMCDIHQQYSNRDKKFSEALKSKESLLKYLDNCIKKYKNIISVFPEKSNLNAQVVGTTQFEGFRIEKIIFESLPKRYVTANLYMPDGNESFPVSLSLCGHGLGGKTPASSAAILMALNKIAVLVVDPVGQGERIQFVDENSKSLTRGATTEHTILNMGANLVGTSVAAYEYWDNHRAIDYLETRPDIDKTRIGIFGSSGGGTQASYMLGLDQRIKVATVCSYFTQRERVFETYGASDGCQHIPYEGREQLEIADFVLMMAPKPVLIMSGKYDFVDYWGATQAFKDLKAAYNILESPEKVSMFSAEVGHGMPKPKREAMVSWFKKWFYNDSNPVIEGERISIPTDNLKCTSTGQVITAISDNVSMPEYHKQLFENYKNHRTKFLKQDHTLIKKTVLELLGIEVPKEAIDVQQTGFNVSRKYDLYKYQINRMGEMPVPCLVLMPENINIKSNIVLYLNESGKDDILSNESFIDEYINQGTILILADLRGFGETADPSNLNDSKYWNWEYRNSMASMHIGKPIMGQRVVDIITLLDFINETPNLKGRNIKLIANGLYGPTAIHASYLDQRITQTEISRSIKSFYDYLENPLQKDIYTNVLYGVLKYYDLKDLITLLGKNRVRFVD
ncbi:alpha/beta hydrolase family protein [Mariniflexile soesokkakense]|uniref:Alpha/beta hydrolase family protein n=1 Tax=Mariniflexile soesokkakense TaxID=1343160 RepID=A0ABV0AC87_9FLAO